MTLNQNEAGAGTSEVPAPRVCARCKVNPRDRKGSSYCRDCRNAHAAEYRLRARSRPTKEQRVCALEGCEEPFEWSSMHPKQLYCSKSHYMQARHRQMNPRTPAEVLAAGEKRCSKCCEVRTVEWFSPSQWEKPSGGQCRDCWRTYVRRWDEENRERRSAASRRFRARKLLREYGAYCDDIDKILADQGGVCYLCDGPAGEKGFHIDHDHELHGQGLPSFRGLACHGCNVGIGALGEDPGKMLLVASRLQAKKAMLRAA